MTTCVAVALATVITCSTGTPALTPAEAAKVFLASHPEVAAKAPFVAPAGWTHHGTITGQAFGDVFPYYDRPWPVRVERAISSVSQRRGDRDTFVPGWYRLAPPSPRR